MNLQLFAGDGGNGRAVLSPDGIYRYTLERAWSRLPRYVLWLMLNPSTADDSIDDPTVRRCRNFALTWGYTGILVGNLYAYRATDPDELWRQHARGVDVVGPENQRHIVGLLRRATLVVCGWGQAGPVPHARYDVLQAIRAGHAPHFLRMNRNKFGQETEPSHPVRLNGKLQPQRWNVFDDKGNGHGG